MGAEWEAAVARSAVLEEQVEQMTAALRSNEEQLAELEKDVDRYAPRAVHGECRFERSLLPFTASPDEPEAGLEYLEDVGASDDQLIRDLEAAQARQTELTADLEATKQEQAEAEAELETIVAALQEELVAAQDDYEQSQADLQAQIEEEQRRQAEEQRRRRKRSASALQQLRATTAAIRVMIRRVPVESRRRPSRHPRSPDDRQRFRYCPVQGPHTFGDGWGAPRGGGRYHSGIDLVAATGTPLVAVYDGYVERADYSGLGGKPDLLPGSRRQRLLLRPPQRLRRRNRVRCPAVGRRPGWLCGVHRQLIRSPPPLLLRTGWRGIRRSLRPGHESV